MPERQQNRPLKKVSTILKQSANQIVSGLGKRIVISKTEESGRDLIKPKASKSKFLSLWNKNSNNSNYRCLTNDQALIQLGTDYSDQKDVKRISRVNMPGGYVTVDDDEWEDEDDQSTSKRRHGPGRASWKNKIQLFLAFIGYSMGLPNVWRFPYLCYDNGGGAFFIPYIIMLLVCGFPLLYLELAIGQLAQAGPIIAIWKFSPLFKALGIASVILAFVVGLYNIIIVTWSLFYVFKSFGSTLPWSTCHNKWNTKNCYSLDVNQPNLKYERMNMTIPSTQEFFENRVLVLSNDNNAKYKYMQWELAILLFIAWVIVFFGIRRGVKSIGKAFYLTATVPFLVVIILLVKSVKLPGAYLGLNYLIKPDLSKLLKPEIWILGATQSFYSLGIAFGSLIALASYNDENNNIFRDSIVMTFTSSLISIIVMVTTFSVIGHIAYVNNHDIEEAITQGPGLVFVVYPQVFSTLPYTQIWAFLYFLMMICLGLDRQFAMVEVVVTSFYDMKLLDKYLPGRQALVLISCIVSYLIGLVFLARKGILYLHLIDYFVVGISFLHVAFFEVSMIVLFFGVNNLSNLLFAFTLRKPSLYIVICWWSAPFIIVVIMFFHVAKHTPIRYDDIYNYPKWATGFGWFLAYLPIITVITGFLLRICPTKESDCLHRFREGFDSVMSLEALSLRTCYEVNSDTEKSDTDANTISVVENDNRDQTLQKNEMRAGENDLVLDNFYKFRPILYRLFFKPTLTNGTKSLENKRGQTRKEYQFWIGKYHNPLFSQYDPRRRRRRETSSVEGRKRSYVDPEEFVLRFMPEVKKLLDEEKKIARNQQLEVLKSDKRKNTAFTKIPGSINQSHRQYYSISNSIFAVGRFVTNHETAKPSQIHQLPSSSYENLLTNDNIHKLCR